MLILDNTSGKLEESDIFKRSFEVKFCIRSELVPPQSHHCHVDIAQSEVVHSKVWRDLYGHGGHDDSIIPELGIVQDVGQTDEGHILGRRKREKGGNELHF